MDSQLTIELRGRERYAVTWERQLALHSARRAGAVADTLLLVEHEPVITLGRQGDAANLLATPAELAALGVDLHRIERGGDITWHGPGQLVGYPIIDLRAHGLAPREYMQRLEESFIAVCARFGVVAVRLPGLTGVWVGPAGAERKICALGVAIRGGVSFHGFAFNVASDLSAFTHIVPCGIADHGVTALSVELGREVTLDEVLPVVVKELLQGLGYDAL